MPQRKDVLAGENVVSMSLEAREQDIRLFAPRYIGVQQPERPFMTYSPLTKLPVSEEPSRMTPKEAGLRCAFPPPRSHLRRPILSRPPMK
jgi:hypothetical protein